MLKEQLLYYCINNHGAQIPDCVTIKQREKNKFSVPTSVDLIKLCTIKTFEQNDDANDNANYEKYLKEDKTNYEKTYKIKYRIKQDERWRNRYREDKLKNMLIIITLIVLVIKFT